MPSFITSLLQFYWCVIFAFSFGCLCLSSNLQFILSLFSLTLWHCRKFSPVVALSWWNSDSKELDIADVIMDEVEAFLNALAFSTYNFRLLQSWMQLVQFFIFNFFMSFRISSSHQFFGLPSGHVNVDYMLRRPKRSKIEVVAPKEEEEEAFLKGHIMYISSTLTIWETRKSEPLHWDIWQYFVTIAKIIRILVKRNTAHTYT